jgi:hyperosmotically inducible periplasmic protein
MKQIKNVPISRLAALASCALALALAACDSSAPPKTATAASQPAVPPMTQPVPAAEKAAEAAKPDPDAELAARIKSAFASDPDVKMLPIDVRAANGAVTLYGTADNAKLRDRAVRIASKVEGVKSVSDNLQIVKGS